MSAKILAKFAKVLWRNYLRPLRNLCVLCVKQTALPFKEQNPL